MSGGQELIECVICNDCLVDPRALPCGHSYCGPPRLCLNSLETTEGALRCAVCRSDHDLKPGDIKPLYGIRDYLLESSHQNVLSLCLPCPEHQNNECTIWCNNCHFAICDECFEDEHDGHSMRKLKKYLVEIIEAKFGKSLSEGITEYVEDLQTLITSKRSELEKLKSQVTTIESEVESAEKQKEVLHDYLQLSTVGIAQKNVNEEISLLWSLSKLDLLVQKSSEVSVNSKKSDQVRVTSLSMQEGKSKNLKFSNNPVASKNQAFSKSERFQNEEARASSSSWKDEFVIIQSLNARVSSTNLASFCSFCGYLKQDCPLGAENFTIRFTMRVIKCNPLKILQSGEQRFCKLSFWMSTEVGAVLSFVVNCRHEGIISSAIKFLYTLTLLDVHGKGNEDKMKGMWSTNEALVWMFGLPQAVKINRKNWVNECGDIKFLLKLEQI